MLNEQCCYLGLAKKIKILTAFARSFDTMPYLAPPSTMLQLADGDITSVQNQSLIPVICVQVDSGQTIATISSGQGETTLASFTNAPGVGQVDMAVEEVRLCCAFDL